MNNVKSIVTKGHLKLTYSSVHLLYHILEKKEIVLTNSSNSRASIVKVFGTNIFNYWSTDSLGKKKKLKKINKSILVLYFFFSFPMDTCILKNQVSTPTQTRLTSGSPYYIFNLDKTHFNSNLISFQTFFVQAFKIIVDYWKFSMLLLYILWDDWPISMISGSNQQLQQQLEYTQLKPDCHSWWISKMQSGCEDTLEERYAIKFCFKLGKSATETYGMLQTAFGPSCMNRVA